MLLAGDEVARTQQGNNNAYCHDSPLSWFDWTRVDDNAELLRFARRCIAFRAAHPVLRARHHPHGEDRTGTGYPDISWHGVRAWQPDWSPESRLLAFVRSGPAPAGGADYVYLVANAHWQPQQLELPLLPDGARWHRFADTSAAAPADVSAPGSEPALADQRSATVGPRSTLVLVGRD